MSDLGLLRRLWLFLRRDRWLLLYALVVTPAIAALSLAQPYLLKRAIDDHIVPGVAEGLGRVALLYLLAVAAAYVLEATYTLAIAFTGQRTILRLRESLYRHTLGLAQSYFDRQPAGRLLTRLTSDIDALGEAVGSGVVTIFLDVLLIVGTLVTMFWLDARLTIALLCLAPPLLILLDVLRRRLRALFMEIRESLADVNAYLAERIDGVQIVQLFGNEELSKRQFDRHNRRFRNATSTSNVYDALMYAVVDGAGSILVAAMLWYGSGAVESVLGISLPTSGALTAGLVVAFIEYLERLFRPLRELSSKVAIIQRALAALEKIFQVFDEGEKIDPEGRPVVGVTGHLRLDGVRFRYREGSEEVLKGIDLEVEPGEVIAVVGATGSGKTTLTRLLDRSYAGYEGSITLDGEELSALRLADVRRQVAGVRQDVQLFSETVRFNVDLGNPTIDLPSCEEAARLVHADRFIRKVGWEHALHERGGDLSVGEAQLLTFARAMAHDPAIVILDEATASIDSLTEVLIQDAIARILERKTVIVIAHRLSTIQKADRILVMDAGEIVEEGTHDELLAADGAYAALIKAGSGATAA